MEIGKYIVSEPLVCGGELTFRGTRILVRGVLESLEEGLSFDEIIKEWHHKITKEAILEAIHLANQTFIKHQKEFIIS